MGASRALALQFLERIDRGRIDVVEPDRTTVLGEPGGHPRATVTVRSPRAWRRMLRGSTGLAEGYAEGLWECDDLVALVRVGALNIDKLDRVRERLAPLLRAGQRIGRLVPRNTRAGSRANISAHYDLGNRLFELFLDPTLTYSCAYFEDRGLSLEDAQRAKLDRACRSLALGPDDHLLEIGSGWGSMALHAAERYGCRVTTTTISAEQAALARRRVQEAGFGERVRVLEADYRDLEGRYDKLVSIEMIEAVGWQYFDTFFARCAELLEPDGLMFLQAIVIDDRAYELEKASRTFANRHIFPGGCLPSLEVIHGCAAKTGLRPVWSDDITEHYAETLRRWRAGFLAAEPEAAELGYDKRFRRIWELYLAWSEGGFLERRIGDVQMLFAKPGGAS